MNMPRPISARAPIAAPAPIPALAPVESPELALALSVDVAVEEAAEVGVVDAPLAASEVMADEDVTGDRDDGIADAGTVNCLAIVYRGLSVSVPQQESLSPQHQIVELTVPSHGVTI